MMARKVLHTLFGVLLLGVLATSSIGAMPDARKTTYFTFSKAVQVHGVMLNPGTYTFEIMNPDTSADVVRISNRNRSKLHVMTLTRAIERPRSGDLKPAIMLGEASASAPAVVKAWFADGETRGREFLY
jgi:hypothetical protein